MREVRDRPEIVGVGSAGVYAPSGKDDAQLIIKAALVLEQEFEIAPYVSRSIVRRLLAIFPNFASEVADDLNAPKAYPS